MLIPRTGRWTAVCLSLLIASPRHWLEAQDLAVPPPPRLQIAILEGEAAIHNVRDRKPVQIVVMVRDAARKPVPGAKVTFTVPDKGASATFGDGRTTTTVVSDKDGYATARQLRPNSIPGPFAIQVEARHQGDTATATISQFNMTVTSKRGGSGKWVALLLALGGAAAGGAVAATRGGNSPAAAAAPPPAPIGITPGPGSVGPPR